MRSFLIAALVLVPSLAAADSPAPTPSRTADAVKMKNDDCARQRAAKKECVLDMGGEEIEGGKVMPNGIGVGILKFGTHDSLIRIRRDFIVEIIKSAEDLD